MNSRIILKMFQRLPLSRSPITTPLKKIYTPIPVYFSSKKNNDQEPNENQDPDRNNQKLNWKERFREKVKLFNNRWDLFYRKRWQVSSIVGLSVFMLLFYLVFEDKRDVEVSVTDFFSLLATNQFKQIIFVEEEFLNSKNSRGKRVQGKTNAQTFYCYVGDFEEIMRMVLRNQGISYKNQRRSGYELNILKSFNIVDSISLLVIIGLVASSTKKQNQGMMMGTLEKKKKFQITKNVSVKFNDVAGLHQVKREIQEIVDFLKAPEKYNALGATIPKGALMTGPPGTGKTLLAKACAGEAGVPFYSVSGTDFVEVYVGVGAQRVRELFSVARAENQAAIIFIDQIDAIGKKRGRFGNDESDSTLNQLLVEMDGFESTNKIVVMGATNRKQLLDQALVRPGRFDREVQVGLPDLKGRLQIFQVHLKPLKLSSKYSMDEYATRLASLTPGFSGAEIASLCNEAAILSARHGKQVVQMIDFQLSSERVIGGVERKGFVSLEQKKTVAYHECGHAVVSWFLQGADPLLKVTIIPRSKGALGFAQYFINQNQLQTKQQLMDRICFILGGRCAELYFFKQITTGAYDDLEKAYDLAYNLITKYGMNSEIGNISYPDSNYKKAYSEKISGTIDTQITKIIKMCTQKTMLMVAQYQQQIRNLAEQLLVKETLDMPSIQKIIGKRPFPPNPTFQAYLQSSNA